MLHFALARDSAMFCFRFLPSSYINRQNVLEEHHSPHSPSAIGTMTAQR
jgi:hypothetical protein